MEVEEGIRRINGGEKDEIEFSIKKTVKNDHETLNISFVWVKITN